MATFKAITIVNSHPGDIAPHTLDVQMFSSAGEMLAKAAPYKFVFTNNADPTAGFGTFTLTTDFAIDVSAFPILGAYIVWAFLDGERVAGAAFMLRRC